MRFLTHPEVARLADSIDQRYGSLVLLAAYGGLRAGELFALRWENVDLDHLCIRVVEQVQHVSGHLLISATNLLHAALARTVMSRPACSSQLPGAGTSATPTSVGAHGRRQRSALASPRCVCTI